MDWIIEHEEFLIGMAVGALVVLTGCVFMVSHLHTELKNLERDWAVGYERIDRENDAD